MQTYKLLFLFVFFLLLFLSISISCQGSDDYTIEVNGNEVVVSCKKQNAEKKRVFFGQTFDSDIVYQRLFVNNVLGVGLANNMFYLFNIADKYSQPLFKGSLNEKVIHATFSKGILILNCGKRVAFFLYDTHYKKGKSFFQNYKGQITKVQRHKGLLFMHIKNRGLFVFDLRNDQMKQRKYTFIPSKKIHGFNWDGDCLHVFYKDSVCFYDLHFDRRLQGRFNYNKRYIKEFFSLYVSCVSHAIVHNDTFYLQTIHGQVVILEGDKGPCFPKIVSHTTLKSEKICNVMKDKGFLLIETNKGFYVFDKHYERYFSQHFDSNIRDLRFTRGLVGVCLENNNVYVFAIKQKKKIFSHQFEKTICRLIPSVRFLCALSEDNMIYTFDITKEKIYKINPDEKIYNMKYRSLSLQPKGKKKINFLDVRLKKDRRPFVFTLGDKVEQLTDKEDARQKMLTDIQIDEIIMKKDLNERVVFLSQEYKKEKDSVFLYKKLIQKNKKIKLYVPLLLMQMD